MNQNIIDLKEFETITQCGISHHNINWQFYILKHPLVKQNDGEIIALNKEQTTVILIDDMASNMRMDNVINHVYDAMNKNQFEQLGFIKIYYMGVENGKIIPLMDDTTQIKEFIKVRLYNGR